MNLIDVNNISKLSLIRATSRHSGLLKRTKPSSVSIGGQFFGIKLLQRSEMASGSECSQQKQRMGLTLHSIRSLNQGESNYVKPMRMHFTLNGRTRFWDCLKAHDSVACVIYNTTRKKLIYVKQFRPAVYLSSLTSTITDLTDFDPTKMQTPTDDKVGFTMELCAGIADKKGKSPQEVMQEEIFEETGYNVPLESVKFISSFRGSTGLSGTLMNLFFAEVTDEQRQTQGGGVDDEAIEVMELDIEEARKAIYCRDEDAPYSRPPAMLFGTCWFLTEHWPKISK